MKVKKTIASSSKTASEIDFFEGIKLPRKAKREAAKEIGELLLDSTLVKIGNAKSPIAGAGWPALSKDYRKFKISKNRPGEANIEFSGDTLDSYDFNVKPSGVLEMGVFGGDTAPIADGHNNISGKSDLPTRQWLPKQGDRYSSDIMSNVDDIIARSIAKNARISRRKLSKVKSKTELFDVLGEIFQGLTRGQITDAIVNEPELLTELTALGLLDFLDL